MALTSEYKQMVRQQMLQEQTNHQVQMAAMQQYGMNQNSYANTQLGQSSGIYGQAEEEDNIVLLLLP